MIVTYSAREKQLMRAMKDHGYTVRTFATCVKLVQKGVPGFTSDNELPWAFRSVHSAAEHLIPIIRDDNYRVTVAGGTP